MFKKVLSFIMAIVLIVSVVPMYNFSADAATTFSPRLSLEKPTNIKYYKPKSSYNPFAVNYSAYGGNCTWYAWGRAYEILGTRPKLGTGNAKTWWTTNKSKKYYEYGQTPRPGAIACWTGTSCGHVAVVEGINPDGSIIISESGWSSCYFRTKTLPANGKYGNLVLQGYIYIGDFSNYFVEIPYNASMVTAEKNVKVRPGPYEKSGLTRTIATVGTSVNIVAKYVNTYGNLWYKLDDGNWIYSERLSPAPVNQISFATAKSSNKKTTRKTVYTPEPVIVAKDAEYTITGPAPERDGYTFIGWAKTDNATKAEYQIGDKIKTDSNITLYPVWKQSEITMDFEKHEVALTITGSNKPSQKVGVTCRGSFKIAPTVTCVSDNTNVATAAIIDVNFDSNWLFKDKQTCKVNISAQNPGDATIVVSLKNNKGEKLMTKTIIVSVGANYEIKYYEVSGSSPSKTETKQHNKEFYISGYVPTKTNHTFLGWTTTAGSSTIAYGPGDQYKKNEPLNLYAVWSENYRIDPPSFNNGVLTITGLGDMASYTSSANTPWAQYSSTATKIVIDSGITSIGANAFAGFKNVTEISLPYGLTRIGQKAFADCKKLSTITIPLTVVSLGTRSFSGCDALKSMYIPGLTKSITTQSVENTTSNLSIGAFAFENCVNLKAANIPETVNEIGIGAFSGCSALSEVTIPSTIIVIDDTTFFNCNSITEINLPSSIDVIGDGAFSGCAALEEIIIPDGTTEIGDQAFSGCNSAEKAVVPSSVDNYGAGIFSNCSALVDLTLPKDMEYIGSSMFSGCSSLEKIVLPAGVTFIGEGAFRNCSALTNITMPNTINEISENTFWGCSSLKNIVIPDSVVSIEDFAFCSSGLKNVDIPEGVEIVGVMAFADCQSLEKVSLPASITLIDDGAFMNCASLTNVDCVEAAVEFGDEVFLGCGVLRDIYLPASTVKMGENVFGDCASNFNPTVFSTSSIFDEIDKSYDNKTVIYPVNGISLDITEKEVFVGDTFKLTANVSPNNATDKTVAWFSDTPEVVTVTDGTVSAISGGCATVYAMSNDNKIVASCYVRAVVPMEKIELTASEFSGYVGDTYILDYMQYPSNATNLEVMWVSSDESIAKVDETGEVTLLNEGVVEISVIGDNGKVVDKCIVTSEAFVELTDITIDEAINLTVGETISLSIQIAPQNASILAEGWYCEDNNIVSISEDGELTALSPGTATIYAYVNEMEKACLVTVSDNLSIAIKNPSVTTINYGETLIMHADFGGVELPEGWTIQWTVEGAGFNMAPAADGLTCKMTSVANGNATVKATLVDENGEAVLDAEGNEMSDTQELKSNANFWQKIVSFFKNLFRISRIILQSI